jgi:hypothetical protein
MVLCYLEAIRSKVPELFQRQRDGDEETGASNRIIQGEIEMSEEMKFTETVYTSSRTTDKTEGARIATQPSPLPPPPPTTTTTPSIQDPHESPSPPLGHLPPLPSPFSVSPSSVPGLAYSSIQDYTR